MYTYLETFNDTQRRLLPYIIPARRQRNSITTLSLKVTEEAYWLERISVLMNSTRGAKEAPRSILNPSLGRVSETLAKRASAEARRAHRRGAARINVILFSRHHDASFERTCRTRDDRQRRAEGCRVPTCLRSAGSSPRSPHAHTLPSFSPVFSRAARIFRLFGIFLARSLAR